MLILFCLSSDPCCCGSEQNTSPIIILSLRKTVYSRFVIGFKSNGGANQKVSSPTVEFVLLAPDTSTIQWTFEDAGNGLYFIRNGYGDDMYLGYEGDEPTAGTRLRCDQDKTKWMVKKGKGKAYV